MHPICRWVALPLQVLTKITAPLIGQTPPLGSNREPNSAARIPPTWRPNFVAGIPPTWRSGSSPCCGLSPTQSRRIKCIVWVAPHFRTLSKFAGKYSREPINVRDIWYIYTRVCLFRLSPRHTSFVWLEAEKIKHFRKVWSFKYYLNTIFAYACMNCSTRITDYVCLAYKCTKHMVYIWRFS